MTSLPDICSPHDIQLGVTAINKAQLLSYAARQLGQRHALDSQLIASKLQERELAGSTAINHGLAIPHARIAGLQHAHALLLRLQRAIDFNAPDRQQVHTALVLLVPQNAQEQHLQLLATCARIGSERPFREALARCHDAGEIYQLLCAWSDPDASHDPHFLLDSNRYFIDSEASLRPDYSVRHKVVARF